MDIILSIMVHFIVLNQVFPKKQLSYKKIKYNKQYVVIDFY
jgi:hypothetical protein